MTEEGAFGSIAQNVRIARSSNGAQAGLLVYEPKLPRTALMWVPAMGVPARHYEALAMALACRGVAVGVHEWRGIGSSNRRAGRGSDWGYRELLKDDLPASHEALQAALPDVPLWLGGHSLGGQLASLFAAISTEAPKGIALVASGSPYWRNFGLAVGMAYVGAPLLAALVGYLPGRRIGFGGNEARGVIADWSRSGRTGRYSARGLDVDLDAVLRKQPSPILGLRLRDDWLGPAASLQYLMDKMPAAARTLDVVGPDQFDGQPADHFAWMKRPDAIARRIADWMGQTA
ncbi:putative alpha/beta hydrolase [Luteibacter rhizovicinus]|uniref:Putative alpha/beta hydrolase n=1 Tax=Luteibacter rhizovicinus TaxID=242606 RepID=A0A4R3YXC6_9GAMM|nr:alpha/beta fold hydrolase [Luteibacter rhizovicinus]TCV97192.1 putative alpha/beta hydrolase [Luteibacter rhizovicinus]